jgi:hypothetical protein
MPATKNDWRADGHRWENNGIVSLPRSKRQVIIHYIGDETLSEPYIIRAYGHAKIQKKLFFRTQPSTMTNMKKRFK